LHELQKKIQYKGDSALFATNESDSITDEEIRQKLASQYDHEAYDVLKVLHYVSAPPDSADIVTCSTTSPILIIATFYGFIFRDWSVADCLRCAGSIQT